MSWTELRNSLLLGSQLRTPPVPSWISSLDLEGADAGPVEDTPDREAIDGADRRVLTAISLLAAQRRAGRLSVPTTARIVAAPTIGEDEVPAPTQATQLLDVLLSGGAVQAKDADDAIATWLEHCRRGGWVVEHRQLVPLLDRSTSRTRLREPVASVLGTRGQWLVEHHPAWDWATGNTNESTDEAVDDDAFIALEPDRRVARLVHERRAAPSEATERLARVWGELDARSRASVIAALHDGLGPHDVDFLEHALLDRSKTVRAEACALLDALPTSPRAQRFEALLTVALDGGVARRKLELGPVPEPDKGDIAPNRPSSMLVEQWNRQCVLGGTPLEWWESAVGEPPAKILKRRLSPEDELLEGWTLAAIAQRNETWAEALLAKRFDRRLLGLVDSARSESLIRPQISSADPNTLCALVEHLPTPWSDKLASRVLDRLADARHPGPAVERSRAVLLTGLPSSAEARLERWLVQARASEDKSLVSALRGVLRHLSTHRSIAEAFS